MICSQVVNLYPDLDSDLDPDRDPQFLNADPYHLKADATILRFLDKTLNESHNDKISPEMASYNYAIFPLLPCRKI